MCIYYTYIIYVHTYVVGYIHVHVSCYLHMETQVPRNQCTVVEVSFSVSPTWFLCVQTGASLWTGRQGRAQAEQKHRGLSADALLQGTFVYSFTRTFIHLFVHSFIQSLVRMYVHSYIHSFMHSLIDVVHSFFHSSILSFLHSFTRSFTYFLIIH